MEKLRQIELILANPRGFCAGVERAIEIVHKALEKFGPPIYVRHEIVHNQYVVEDLKNKGVVFVKEISEIPVGSVTIFSAHGVSRKVEEDSAEKSLMVIDATCPLVTKVHREAINNANKGKKIILIGHKGHPEVEGTSGRVDSEVILVSSKEDVLELGFLENENLAYVTQTTLSVDDTKQIIEELKKKFPQITGPELADICYATQNRQNAVKEMAKFGVNSLIVIGAENSSNSNRLKDLGEELGIKSHLIENEKNIDLKWFDGDAKIGITAGASAPEILLKNVLAHFQKYFDVKITEIDGIKENIKFHIPKSLR